MGDKGYLTTFAKFGAHVSDGAQARAGSVHQR
jgi:hypothetical protein